MCCQRCGNGNDQVGGVTRYPCKDKVDQLKKDIMALEKCLIDATRPPTPPRPPRPCHCHCCCCCCRCNAGNTSGNQTTWGR